MTRLRLILGYGLLGFLVFFLHWKLYPYAYDDAYIHFRIARNWVEYGLPYYNVTPPVGSEFSKIAPVMGSTSSLWTWLLAGLFLIFGANVLVVVGLNSLIFLWLCFVWTKLARRIIRPPVEKETEPHVTSNVKLSWVTVLALGSILPSSLGLMETPLAILILGGALYSIYRGRNGLGYFLLGLGCFARPEISIFLGAALILAFWQRQKVGEPILFALLGSCPGLVYGLYYFGTIIPQSIIAKAKVYDLTLAESFTVILDHIFRVSTTPVAKAVESGFIVLLIGLIVLAIIRQKSKPKIDPKILNLCVLLFVPAILLAALWLAFGALVFPWYMPLVTWPVLFCGLVYLYIGKPTRLIHSLIFVIYLPFLFGFSRDIWAGLKDVTTYSDFKVGSRVRNYLDIGRKLYELCPNCRLLAPEIGGLGFGFKGEVVDALGLVTPVALDYHVRSGPQTKKPKGTGKIPENIVTAIKPELVVSLYQFAEVMRQPELEQAYFRQDLCSILEEDRLRLGGDCKVWSSRTVGIYYRRDYFILAATEKLGFSVAASIPPEGQQLLPAQTARAD